MSDLVSRQTLRDLDNPMTHKCPVCHAKPTKECNGFGVHMERVETARSALIREVYNGR